jgi:ABC-type multidrug transport system fused ATPase/permease subunit
MLKDLNFKIKQGENVGIIGANSSIICALMRLAINEGRIEIDEINIETLGLHDLRRSFGLIPSNPVLFATTIRSHLDPFEQHSDDEIWRALERVNLKHTISNIEASLNAPANEKYFTLMQKQLLYIARAIIAKNKILILDETTDVLQIE